jgi:hypothetical protein
LFYVNVGALAVFFFVFGSRFVLAPGLAVDFALPVSGGAATAVVTTDIVIAVPAADMAVIEGAVVDFSGLGEWLRAQTSGGDGSQSARKRLLVQAAGSLPARELARVYNLAADAGFSGVLVATDEAARVRP